MASRNDITGDILASKKNNDNYREGWEAIFGKKDCVFSIEVGSMDCNSVEVKEYLNGVRERIEEKDNEGEEE